MKTGVLLPLLVAGLAPFCWSQTATPPAAPSQATQTSVKPHGPDAIAAQDPNRVVATIDGQKITAKKAADLLKPFPADQRKQLDANLSQAIQQIYTQKQLADAAKKLSLEQQSPWKEQLELTREGVLARAYVAHVSDAAAKAPAEDPQKYYDTHETEFDQAKLSGIFVGFNPPGTPANSGATAKTEDQAREKANDIAKKLKAGGDFAALARAESEHQTASKGGELGSYPINDPSVQIPPDVKTAVGKIKAGEVTEPIRIPNAFLIVRLDAREKVPFDKAKDGIVQKLQAERTQNAVKKELDKYTIKVEDQDFFDTGAAPAPKIPSLARPGSPAPAPAPGTPKP
jgi:hypothetical protein